MELQIFDTKRLHELEQTQVWPKVLILCLDFDGVLHQYTSGWQGPTIITDGPVPGAMEFLVQAVQHFQVHIYSNRCNLPGGIQAMAYWLVRHIQQAHAAIMTEYDAQCIVSQLWFDTIKPPAWLTIDDHAIQFKGVWPDLEVLEHFQPWYKPQTYTDAQLSVIWNMIQEAQNAHICTDAQIVVLLQDIWAKYDVISKESWILMEAMERLTPRQALTEQE